MLRAVLSLLIFLFVIFPADAIGTNRFPFRPFDDVGRPKTADEVRIAYQMLVGRKDGVDKLEAKMIALYELVQQRKELGYDLGKPHVVESGDQWQVRIPSKFSINEGKRPGDFVVCVEKAKGKITCFAPQNN